MRKIEKNETEKAYFRLCLKENNISIMPKRNNKKKIGKAIKRIGIVTLPFPSGSLILIGIGVFMIADWKKYEKKIYKIKRKLANKIRILKIKW